MEKNSYNLSDLRRWLSKPSMEERCIEIAPSKYTNDDIKVYGGTSCVYFSDFEFPLEEAGSYLRVNDGSIRWLDWLISKLGANWPNTNKEKAPKKKKSSGVSRPKNTSEVAPTSENPSDGDLHGGDGASGEVEDSTSAGSPDDSGSEVDTLMAQLGDGSGATSEQEGAQDDIDDDQRNAMGGDSQGLSGVEGVEAPGSASLKSSLPSNRAGVYAEDKPHKGEPTAQETGDQSDLNDVEVESESEHLSETKNMATATHGDSTSPDVIYTKEEISTLRYFLRRMIWVLEGTSNYHDITRNFKMKLLQDNEKRIKTLIHDLGSSKESQRAAKQTLNFIKQMMFSSKKFELTESFYSVGECTNNHSFGGRVYMSKINHKFSLRDMRNLEKELTRLSVQHCGPSGDPTPRIRAKKLVTELVTRRMNLTRCHREELESKKVILAVDVSGSCATFGPTLEVALKEVAAKKPHVLVVLHSNGFVVEITQGKKSEKFDETQGLLEVVKGFGDTLGLVVGIGDSDALLAYQAAAEATKFIWLNNYLASRGVPQRAHAKLTKDWVKQPYAHIIGVGSATTVIEALKLVK
jgi:hypothetical protein